MTTTKQAKAFHALNRIENTPARIKNTKTLLKLFNVDKITMVSSLQEYIDENPECILKEWTSKKGVDYVKVQSPRGAHTQLEKISIENYSVSEDGIITNTGVFTKN